MRGILNRNYNFGAHALRLTWSQVLNLLQKEYAIRELVDGDPGLVVKDLSLLGLWKSPTQEEEREVLTEELTVWLGHQVDPEAQALPTGSPRSLTPPSTGNLPS